MLDPRFKKVPFQSSQSIKSTKEKIVAECKDRNESRTSNTEMETINQLVKHDNELWKHFENKMKKMNKISNPTSMSCEYELKKYLRLSVINRSCDPFVWWMSEGTVFPQLQKLAKKYLSMPATSVPSERIFSKAGEILSQRRSRLQPKYVNMLTVISMNK
ncbi:Zinc finger BED domain-containing protein [Ooceraea biroi]|uniref:Zinc finger BED domain-containing protein n=1 Tax=Ooceraea biroi TaxID=2015173 RepID=A0A026WSB6_OOCBI|nr:Zinc finger BED domain-containing protein [Ooceraea biroi]